MNPIEIAALDLNLLPVLAVLLEERSVTRAGRRLGRTPSAVSHALSRLRELLDDPILVRTGSGLRPTPLAEQLRAPLEALLGSVEGVVRAEPFDPARSRRQLALVATDYLQLVWLPPLMARLAAAPGLDLRVLAPPDDLLEALGAGQVDMALVVSFREAPALHVRTLGEDRFVCLLREGHPALERGLDLQTYASLGHVLVAPSGRPGGFVDRALEREGLRRRVAVQLPHFLAAPALIARTELVLTVPERLARALQSPGLVLAPAPLALEPIPLRLIWHERTHADPACRWLRERVAELAGLGEAG